MGEVIKRGEFSQLPYRFRIAGDAPTVDEQMQIDQILRTEEFKFAKDYEQKYERPLTDEGSGVLNYLGEFPKGIARGAVGGLESAALFATPYLPESVFGVPVRDPYREGLRSLAYSAKPLPDVGMEDTVSGNFGQALGSFVPLVATALATKNPAAVSALSAAMGGGEATERAISAGATVDQQRAAGLLGAGVGTLGAISPLRLSKAMGEPATLAIIDRVRRAAIEGGVEGATEAAENIAQNLIEQGIYNPEQGTFTDTGEAFGYGAGVGGFVKGLLDLAIPGKTPGAAPPARLALPAPSAATPTSPSTAATSAATRTATPIMDELLKDEGPAPTIEEVPTGEGLPRIVAVMKTESKATPLSKKKIETRISLSDGKQLVVAGNIGGKNDPRVKAAVQRAYAPAAGATVVPKAPKAEKPKVEDIPEAEVVPEPTVVGKRVQPTVTLPEATEPVLTEELVNRLGVGTAKSAKLRKLIGSPLSQTSVIQALNSWAQNDRATPEGKALAARLITGQPEPAVAPEAQATNIQPEDVRMAPTANAKVAEPVALVPEEVKAAAAPVPEAVGAPMVEAAPTPTTEVQDDTTAAAPEPIEVGAGVQGGERGLGASGGGPDVVPSAERVEAPQVGGLGGGMPLSVGTPAAEGAEPSALTGPQLDLALAERYVTKTPIDVLRAAQPLNDPKNWASEPDRVPDVAKQAIAKLLETPDANLSPQARSAKLYFSKTVRPVEALRMILDDIRAPYDLYKPRTNVSAATNAFMAGTGKAAAKQAMEYIEQGGFPDLQTYAETLTLMVAESGKVQSVWQSVRSGQSAPKAPRGSLKLVTDSAIAKAGETSADMAALDPLAALDQSLHYAVTNALKEGDLRGALLALADTTNNRAVANLANKLTNYVGTTRVRVLDPVADAELSAEHLGGAAGKYWQSSSNPDRQNIIYLDGAIGLNVHTLLHEVVHPTTARLVQNNPNHPTTRQLEALRAQLAENAPEGPLDEDGRATPFYGLKSVSEFIAEAFSRVAYGADDVGLRNLMRNTVVRPVKIGERAAPLSAVDAFREIVGNLLRMIVGLPSKTLPREIQPVYTPEGATADEVFQRLVDGILSPAPQVLPASVIAKSVSNAMVGRRLLNASAAMAPTWDALGQQRLGETIRENIPPTVRGLLLSLQQMDWLADSARGLLPVADKVKTEIDKRQGTLDRLQKLTSQLPRRYSDLASKDPSGFARFMSIMGRSTVYEVDITKPQLKYKDDADKSYMWQTLTDEMKAIDPLGEYRQLYALSRDLYAKLRDEYLTVVNRMAEGVTDDKALQKTLRDRIMAKLIEDGVIDPYFPLMRQGNYWVSYTITEDTSGPPAIAGAGGEPDIFPTNQVVQTFQSAMAAKAFIAQLQKAELDDGRPAASDIQQFMMEDAVSVRGNVPLQYVQGAMSIVDTIVPSGAQNLAGKEALYELFVKMAPAYSAVSAFRKRKGTLGFMGYDTPIGGITEPKEFVVATQDRLSSMVHQIANFKHAAELNKLAVALEKELKSTQAANIPFADKVAAQALASEIGKRIQFAKAPTANRMAYHMKGATFALTLGLLPAAVINVFFQIPMVILPQLLGRYGSVGTLSRTLKLATQIAAGSGMSQLMTEPGAATPTAVRELENWGAFENYYEVDPAGNFVIRTDKTIPDGLRKTLEELAPLARHMSINGMMGHTIAQAELSGVMDVMSRVYRFMGLPLHYAERYTRQTTAIAAFLMEQDKIRKAKKDENYQLTPAEVDAAVKLAADTMELTNGTVGPVSGPRAAQGGFGSLVFMYKRYALTMLRFMANGVKNSLTKITPDMTEEQVANAKMERSIARYQLAMMIGSTAVFAGVQGLPFFGEAMSILDLLFTDDEEDDFATMAQKSLQEPFYHGLINYITGAEVASRISMSGLIFRENKIEKNQSMLYDLAEMLGGPVLGTYFNIERGINQISEGEIYRGIESMSPSSLRSILRAMRYETEGGATTKRGDQIVPTSNWDVALQLLGYTPENYARTQEATGREKRKTEAARNRKNKLYKRYNDALGEGDYEALREVLKDMAEFSREYPENGKFDLAKSRRGFQQRSEEMISGVYFPDYARANVEESFAEYDPSTFE